MFVHWINEAGGRYRHTPTYVYYRRTIDHCRPILYQYVLCMYHDLQSFLWLWQLNRAQEGVCIIIPSCTHCPFPSCECPEPEIATPPLNGLILPGVVRKSLIELARQWVSEVELCLASHTIGLHTGACWETPPARDTFLGLWHCSCLIVLTCANCVWLDSDECCLVFIGNAQSGGAWSVHEPAHGRSQRGAGVFALLPLLACACTKPYLNTYHLYLLTTLLQQDSLWSQLGLTRCGHSCELSFL